MPMWTAREAAREMQVAHRTLLRMARRAVEAQYPGIEQMASSYVATDVTWREVAGRFKGRPSGRPRTTHDE